MKFQNTLLGLLMLLASNLVNANIINGDFENGLVGWNQSLGDASLEREINGQLLLTEDLFSVAGVIQGDDFSFFFNNPILVPTDALSLSFDVKFSSIDDGSGDSGLIDDILRVSLFDSLDLALDLEFLFGAGSPISTVFQTIDINVSTLLNRNIALAFEVLPGQDGQTFAGNGFLTTFHIDNIRFTTPTSDVPAPHTLALLLLSMGLLTVTYRKAQRT